MPIEKIIVLEDDLVVRKTLEQQLRYRRYDVASAENIASAVELLGKDNFDLMIVDVKLPDGDGIELLKQLNSRPSRPLVVIISSHGTVDMAVECMSNGAFTFLTKPISAEHLAVTLKNRLRDLPIAEGAARQGLWTMPLSSCFLGKPSRQGLVLGYGGTSVAEIPAAVQRLRRVVAAFDRA